MRVLFCKISSMKYYKGHCKDDVPMYGGAYVEENGYGHEEYNFMPVVLDEKDYSECVGFVEPKSNKGTRNSLHIEKIEGCAAMKKESFIEDVLVIWCATRNLGDKTDITVVGWYKHATVFRDLTDWTMAWDDGTEEDLLKAGRLFYRTDTRQILVEADADRAVHRVVVGRHRVQRTGGVDLFPPLPNGGRAVFDHIAPAGVVGLGQQVPRQIFLAV